MSTFHPPLTRPQCSDNSQLSSCGCIVGTARTSYDLSAHRLHCTHIVYNARTSSTLRAHRLHCAQLVLSARIFLYCTQIVCSAPTSYVQHDAANPAGSTRAHFLRSSIAPLGQRSLSARATGTPAPTTHTTDPTVFRCKATIPTRAAANCTHFSPIYWPRRWR